MRADLTLRKRLVLTLAVLTLLFLLIGVRIGGLCLMEGESSEAAGQ